MKYYKTERKLKLGIIPKLAKKLGQNSVNQTCILWFYQPPVPNVMRKEKK